MTLEVTPVDQLPREKRKRNRTFTPEQREALLAQLAQARAKSAEVRRKKPSEPQTLPQPALPEPNPQTLPQPTPVLPQTTPSLPQQSVPQRKPRQRKPKSETPATTPATPAPTLPLSTPAPSNPAVPTLPPSPTKPDMTIHVTSLKHMKQLIR